MAAKCVYCACLHISLASSYIQFWPLLGQPTANISHTVPIAHTNITYRKISSLFPNYRTT